MKRDAQDVIDEFVERMGFAAQADGLPRIAGRILGLLVIEGGPLSFNDLATRLQVSRGSISTNSRILEQLGVLERASRSGDRQDYFRLTRDPYIRLLRGLIERMIKVRDVVVRTKDELPPELTGVRGRLGALAAFYDQTSTGLSHIAGEPSHRPDEPE